MEGIDRIKDHILTEADAEVEAIVKETRDVIEREILAAEEERRKILIEAAERADLDAALLIKRGRVSPTPKNGSSNWLRSRTWPMPPSGLPWINWSGNRPNKGSSAMPAGSDGWALQAGSSLCRRLTG